VQSVTNSTQAVM